MKNWSWNITYEKTSGEVVTKIFTSLNDVRYVANISTIVEALPIGKTPFLSEVL